MKRYLPILFFILSCKGPLDNSIPPPTEYEQPVVQPLKFSNHQKINWDTIKEAKIQPVIKKLDWDKLPEQSYNTSGFKPFKYPVEETKFDYNSLPERDLDIDKLPSYRIKLKSYILPPPKLIKGAKLKLINGNSFVFDFGDAQGNSSISINYLFSSRDGFLWIATNHGLYRYDGESLFLILANPNGSYINSMLQDKLGNIWLGNGDNEGGVEILDPMAGILKKWGAGEGISQLMQDKASKIWAVSNSGVDGIYIVDPKTETVKWLDRTHGLFTSSYPSMIARDENDKIWVVTPTGAINIIDLKQKKIKLLDKACGLKSNSIEKILSDHFGRIWVIDKTGLINVVNIKKNAIKAIREIQFNSSLVFVSSLFQDNKGIICIGTSPEGLMMIDMENRTIMRPKEINRLVSKDVRSMTKDRHGQLWIGTDHGLNLISNNKAVIERIGNDSIISSTEDQQGLIWKTSTHGIDILDRKTGKSKHLGVKQGLASEYVITVKQVNGVIFIDSDRGLDVVDPIAKTIAHLDDNQGGFFVSDKAGSIWFLDFSNKGLYQYTPQKNILKHLDRASRENDDFTSLFVDGQGNFWMHKMSLGFSDHDRDIEVGNPGTGIFKNLIGSVFSGMPVLSDKKGNLWFISKSGICIADLDRQKLILISTSQGLIDNKVISLLEYNGSIYAGTNHGVTILTPPAEGVSSNKKWQVASYGIDKKLLDNYGVDLITKDGIYCSGDIGLTLLNLSRKDTFTSVPYLTGINIFDQPENFLDQARFNLYRKTIVWKLDDKTNYTKKNDAPANIGYGVQSGLVWDNVAGAGNMPINLKIPFDQNFIRFNYSVLNIAPHDTTFYKYILIGKDKKWSDVTNESYSANYINLRPGKYTFEVISRDANNLWSKPTNFSFIITPPWWQTWWAYLLYVVLFAGTTWSIVYIRSQQLVKEKEALEHQIQIRTDEILQQKEEIETQRDHLEMEKIRSNIAADFHDELGSTLSSIALYSEMAINTNSADERTKNILALIGESSRGTVSAMQDMIWTIQPKNDKMQEVIFRMREYAYPLAELKGIILEIDVGEEIGELILSMDIRKNTYLIFKEALNNAFKYASPARIIINFDKKDRSLCMEIKDDGKGFDISSAKKGNGLTNMNRRAEQVGGALIINSSPGGGTEISFSCPVG